MLELLCVFLFFIYLSFRLLNNLSKFIPVVFLSLFTLLREFFFKIKLKIYFEIRFFYSTQRLLLEIYFFVPTFEKLYTNL